MSEKSEERAAFWLYFGTLAVLCALGTVIYGVASPSPRVQTEPPPHRMEYNIDPRPQTPHDPFIQDKAPRWMVQFETCFPDKDCTVTVYVLNLNSKLSLQRIEGLMEDPTIKSVKVERISRPTWRPK